MSVSMNVARSFVIIGFLIGLISLWQTIGHIGDESYKLVSGSLLIDEAELAASGLEPDDFVESLPAERREVHYTLSNGIEGVSAVAEENPEHVWYHLHREANGDIAAMIVILMMLFLPANLRAPRVWWMMIVILAGYYSPFWTGSLVDQGMAAPHMMAELVHIVMAALSIGGVLLARRHYTAT